MEIKLPNFRGSSKSGSSAAGYNDLGFGNKLNNSGQRLINKDGSFNVVRRGRAAWTPYQDLVEMNWTKFILIILLCYLFVNAIFALGFVILGVEGLSGIDAKGFLHDFSYAFFFSVQTFTTVGYGSISPVNVGSNLLASVDALVGLMALALATGLFFARFAKPKAMIAFSKFAILSPYGDLSSLQFRIANRRDNKIINLQVHFTMSWMEKTPDGKSTRRFTNLPLERGKVILFPLNWTIVHPITKESPLFQKTLDEIIAMEAEFLILLEGYDETYAQVVHSSGSYTCMEIRPGLKFLPMYYYDKDYNRTVLELNCINKVVEV